MWTSHGGHYGHSQVPENLHGDPGALDPNFVKQSAKPKAQRTLLLTKPMLHGPDVAEVAKYLNDHHFPCGTPIDVFGPQMDGAVRGFQKAKHLTVTGRFGAPERRAAGLPV